jgi:predicted molibdopterin-dependent oxidoreductase YjgC
MAPSAEIGTVTIILDGEPLSGVPGSTVASLLLANEVRALRLSPRAGTPRGAFCLMGVCQECVLTIDGVVRQACLVIAQDGMVVSRPSLSA